jgi:transcriptional regulator NrdR family protein
VTCGAVFSTLEIADYEASWRVLDPKGSLHPFLRNKLLVSLHKSLEHRPKSIEDATGLVETVISLLRPLANRGTLEANQITITVQQVLTNFDNAAATHYAAFHKL